MPGYFYEPVVPYGNPVYDPVYPARGPFNPWNPYQTTPGLSLPSQLGLNWVTQLVTGMTGGVPMGFSYGGPLQQNLRHQMQTQQYQNLMQSAWLQDTAVGGAGNDFARSIAKTFFPNVNADKLTNENLPAFARDNAGLAAGLLASGAIPRDVIESLSGGRSRIPLYAEVFQAGTGRIDPFTGRRGYAADSARQISDKLYDYYGFNTPDEYLGRARGLTSGQIGGLYGELSRRGMFEGGGFSSKSGAVDMQKVGQKMEEWTDALGAVNELFTSQGKYNTSTQELFAALEQMTAGSVYSVDPQQIARMFGNLTNVARLAQVSNQSLTYMMQQAGAQGQQMGLVNAGEWGMRAVTGALGFHAAATDAGLYSTVSYGQGSPQQVMAMRQQLEMNNSNSRTMRMLGLMRRASQQFGVEGDRSAASQLQRILSQAEVGVADPSLTGDYTKLIEMTARATGRSQAEINEMFTQTTANEQAAAEMPGTNQALMHATRREFARETFGLFGRAVFGRVAHEAGLRGDTAQSVADRMSSTAQDILTDEKNIDLVAKLRARGDGTELGNRRAAAQRLEAQAQLGRQLMDRARASNDPAVQQYIQQAERSKLGAVGEFGNQIAGVYNQAEGQAQSDPRFRGMALIDMLRATSSVDGGVTGVQAETELMTLSDQLARSSGMPPGDVLRRLSQGMQSISRNGKPMSWTDMAMTMAARAGNIANPTADDPTVRALAGHLQLAATAQGALDRAETLTDEMAAKMAAEGQTPEQVAAFRKSREQWISAYRERAENYEADLRGFLEQHPEFKKAAEERAEEQEKAAAAAGSPGASTITLNIGTLNLDKAGIVIKDASGTGSGEAKTESNRGSAGGRGT